MDFEALAKSRYSVRNFDGRPLSGDDLDYLLSIAHLAPTGCNYQPQRIYVVQSDTALAKLHSLSRCIFGAKTVLIFAYDTTEDWKNKLEPGVHSGEQDVSIVASHVMLAAWERGIGSCWVNYFANELLRQEMGLPEQERVVLLMPMGYPAADAAPLPLHSQFRPMAETVHYI